VLSHFSILVDFFIADFSKLKMNIALDILEVFRERYAVMDKKTNPEIINR